MGGLREAFHWIPGEILTILVVSKTRFEDSVPNLTKSGQISTKSEPNQYNSGSTITAFGNKLGWPAPALPCRGSFSKQIDVFLDFRWIFKVLKSWDSEPGTPLERSGSKFRFKSRAWELRSIYGDPFREDFVPIGVGQGSGASSLTFSIFRCFPFTIIIYSPSQDLDISLLQELHIPLLQYLDIPLL